MDLTLLLIIVGAAATVAVGGFGLYQLATRRRTILADRVRNYAGIEAQAALAADDELQKLSPISRIVRTLAGRGYISRIEDSLTRADVPLRVSEYILIRWVLAGAGLLIGLYGSGQVLHGALLAMSRLIAVALAVAGFFAPAVFLWVKQNQRRAKFVRQLADALMLLTNSLRSGYSFLKGLELVAKEMEDPISKELSRTLREVNLGATIDEALTNLGRRVNSPDLDIVISAFLVQKEVGGNLTEIMQKVAETIRERLKIQGDIKVLTAQGRLSGMIVGALPFFVFFFIFIKNPSYFGVLLEDPKKHLFGFDVPLGVMLFAAAVVMQAIGGYLIYKIVSIKT